MNKIIKSTQLFRILLASLFVISVTSPIFAQKQKPIRATSITKSDTTIVETIETAEDEKTEVLPIIDLKEHVITGEQQVETVPIYRNPVDKSISVNVEDNPTKEGKSNRSAPAAGGDKEKKEVVQPISEIVNEFYASYGKYAETSAGLKLRKRFVDDELFTNLDYEYNEGHLPNAGFESFSGSLINIHRFNKYTQNKSEISLKQQGYRFYGAATNFNEKRTRFDLDLNSVTDFRKWSPLNFRLENGVRYLDPDNSQLFNWNVWTNISGSGAIGSTYINGSIQFILDRIEEPLNASQLDSLHSWIIRELDRNPIDYIDKIRDDIGENITINEAYFGKTQLRIERLITPRLHIRIGGTYFQYLNDYNDLLQNSFYVVPEINGEIESAAYPNFSAEFNFGIFGSVFLASDPKVVPITLSQKLNINPYLNLATPLVFEDHSQNIQIGWRRSSTYNLSFEILFDRTKIENYAMYEDIGTNDFRLNGRWYLVYDNVVELDQIRAMLNWNIHSNVQLWATARYNNYEIKSSERAKYIPYLPELELEYSLQLFPGYDIQVALNGQYAGKRDATTIDYPVKIAKIESHFFHNIYLSKKINNSFEIFINVNNITEEYIELWHGYQLPGIHGNGGIKIFW